MISVTLGRTAYTILHFPNPTPTKLRNHGSKHHSSAGTPPQRRMLTHHLQEERPKLPDLGDSIDADTFEQILEMDDDEEERDFSRSIVYGFFDQAESTFKDMDREM